MSSNRTLEQIKKGNRTPEGVRINKYEQTPEVMRNALMEQMTHGLILNDSKSKMGRPRKYEDVNDFKHAIADYFYFIQDKAAEGAELIPDIEGLCSYIGISRDTLFEWERSRGQDFSDLIKEVRNAIAGYKKQLGFIGGIPPIVLALDFNNNHGYIQQQKIDITASRSWDDVPDSSDIMKRLPVDVN